MGRIGDSDGTVEELLIPIRISLDLTLIGDPEETSGLLSTDAQPGEVSHELIQTLFEADFVGLRELAAREAAQALKARASAAHEARQALVARLREDLERDVADRRKELDEEEKLATRAIDDSGQQRLFAEDPRAGALYRAQRALIDTHYQQRLEELERFAQIEDPPAPEPMGAAFLVPEGL